MGEIVVRERNSILLRWLSLLVVALLAACFFDSPKPDEREKADQGISLASIQNLTLPAQTSVGKIKIPLLSLFGRNEDFQSICTGGWSQESNLTENTQTPPLCCIAIITHRYDTGDEDPPLS